MADTHYFYRDLPKYHTSLAELLAADVFFVEVPNDWAVVMLDVQGSTQAVAAGLHHEVNLAATGGIVAVLNLLHERDPGLEVPYFFGGDGATFLLPPTALDDALDVLDRYQTHVRRTLSLALKVGAHSVGRARAGGHEIRVSKLAVNEHLTLPIVLGTGVKFAEGRIKAALHVEGDEAPISIPALDLQGMECRWDEIKPPRNQQRVVCLLAVCPDDAAQGQRYAAVAKTIDEVFGTHELRHPISGPRLKLDLAIAKTRQELSVRLGRYTFWQLLREWMVTAIGPLYFRFSDAGRAYVTQVVELSHTLMLDGTFNCVLTGTQAQIDQLIAYLDAEEAAGRLQFGLHTTHASLMSCYVVDRDREHAHFVDGTEGGFTSAARALKAKLAAGTEQA